MEFVSFIDTRKGKKLLKVFKSQRAANMFLKKNTDKILSKRDIESVGTMSKKEWDTKEAKYAIEGFSSDAQRKAAFADGYEEKDKKNEGKKRFKRQDGIGKAKYTISFHDGKKKHKDGSDFFDIKIFKNKKDLSDFVGTLAKQGYKLTRESVNEAIGMDKSSKKKVYDRLKKGDKVRIKFVNSIRKGNEGIFVVSKGKTVVGKSRVERITLKSEKYPNAVKYYLYNRNNNIGMAQGDMGAVIEDMEIITNESVNEEFKSKDSTFEKVYGMFDKRDYFNAKGLAKVKIGNFERALQKNDKGAQQILDKFNGDMNKAKEYIIQVITDRKKEEAFNQYKAFKAAVDSIQKGTPIHGAVDLVKSRIHNNSQKYTMTLYSTLRNQKFNKWKDIHSDVDSLIGESVNEAKFKVLASFGGYDLIEAPTEKDMIISKNGKKVGKLTKISKYLKDDIKSFINMVKSGKLGESVNEEKPGLWANIRAKQKRGEKPAHKNSQAHKDAVKAGKKINNEAKFGYKDSTASYINKHKDEYKVAEKMNNGNEKKFYDMLQQMEEKVGHGKTMLFISNALRGYGVDMFKDPKIKNPQDAQEALFLLSK